MVAVLLAGCALAGPMEAPPACDVSVRQPDGRVMVAVATADGETISVDRFSTGTRDVIVGVEHSRRLYAVTAAPKRLEIIEGGGHAEALFRDDPKRFCHLVEAWLIETLPDKLEQG